MQKFVLAAVLILVAGGAHPAAATQVLVEWSAEFQDAANWGSGTISGSFGFLEVDPSGVDVVPLLDVTTLGFAINMSGGLHTFYETNHSWTGSSNSPVLVFNSLDDVNFGSDFSSLYSNRVRGLGCNSVCEVSFRAGGGTHETGSVSLRNLGSPPYWVVGGVTFATTVIPEPSTALLLSLGLTGLAAKGRRSLRS